MNDLTARVIALEELLSHQQHVIQQLNEVVIEIRGEVDRLGVRQEQHQQKLKTLMEAHSEIDDDPNQKPPHY